MEKAILQSHKQNKISEMCLSVFHFYRDGFRSMVLGKTLWKIILIKLLIMFGVLKVFFFPNFLANTYDNDSERASHVLDQITQQQNK